MPLSWRGIRYRELPHCSKHQGLRCFRRVIRHIPGIQLRDQRPDYQQQYRVCYLPTRGGIQENQAFHMGIIRFSLLAQCTILTSPQNTCTNKSFSWKFDSYTESGSILEFKHQYRKNGIPCIQSNGPQCTTSRAYFSTVGLPFTVDSPEGGGNVADVWTGPYDATIFSTCNEGCGLTSGNN